MSPDEARDRFSDALEEALSHDERASFERALAADPALADEFRTFCDVVAETRSLRMAAPRPSVDLLEGAKARIHKRRGRLRRGPFAAERESRRLLPVVVAVLMLLLLGVAFAGMQALDELRAPDAPEAPDAPSRGRP